jgi:hypothetical protein
LRLLASRKRARRNRHVDGSFIGVQSLSADDQGCTTLPHAQGTVIGAVFASFGVPGDLSLGSRQLAGRPRLHLLQPVTDAAAPVASIDAEPGPSNQDVLNAIEASQQQLSSEIQEGFAQWVYQRRLVPPMQRASPAIRRLMLSNALQHAQPALMIRASCAAGVGLPVLWFGRQHRP